MTNLLKTTILIIFSSIALMTPLMSSSWGEGIYLPYKAPSLGRLGKRVKKKSTYVPLNFVDQFEKRQLPFWFRRLGSQGNNQWQWKTAGESVEYEGVNYIIEFDLGYGYTKPLPLQTADFHGRDNTVFVRPWHGESWSPYQSAYYDMAVDLNLPQNLQWMEALQIGAGIKTMIWPKEYLNSYPRSTYMSSSEGEWRSLCQSRSQVGGCYFRSIYEYSRHGEDEALKSLDFSWQILWNYVRDLDWDNVNVYSSLSHKEKWNDIEVYPIIPMLFMGSYIDVVELQDKQDLFCYRFLLEQGHRLSQVYINEKKRSKAVPAPDISIYRSDEVASDLDSIKQGRWASTAGFAFDWVLESRVGAKKHFRSGDVMTEEASPVRPLFRFSKHPKFSPILMVKLFKGHELMVQSIVRDDILSGTMDLGRYFLKQQDSMSLEITHMDGSTSVVNPIYVGVENFFNSKIREFPLVIHGLEGELISAEYEVSNTEKTFSIKNNRLEIDVPWYESVIIKIGDRENKIQVWRLWLDQAVKRLKPKSSFKEQYFAFERSFPINYNWQN